MNLLNISENKFYLFIIVFAIVGEFLITIISALTFEILKLDILFEFLLLSIIFMYLMGYICGYYEGVKYERLKGGIR